MKVLLLSLYFWKFTENWLQMCSALLGELHLVTSSKLIWEPLKTAKDSELH